jgi:biotin carboxylase
VGGSKVQCPAVTAARELGLWVAVTDRNPDCACAELADTFYPISIYDTQGHVDLVRELVANDVSVWAVFTAAADPMFQVAMAAQEAGAHHTPIDTANIVSNKMFMRRALGAFDVPQPQYLVCPTPDDTREAVRRFGPSIVKALAAAGGRGHTKVYEAEDVTDEVFMTALERSQVGQVLVEELLEGLELSAETLWWNGAMFPLNAVERPFAHYLPSMTRFTDWSITIPSLTSVDGSLWGLDDIIPMVPGVALPGIAREALESGWVQAWKVGNECAIELGHYNPAMLDAATWDEAWSVVERTGNAIGLGNAGGGHIHKVDLICTAEGVKALETTVRLSGNWDSGRTSPLAHGVDYTLGALNLALGQPPDWSLFTPRWHRHSACLFKFVEPGQVASITQPDTVDVEVITRYDVGDTVPPLDSYAALAAWVIADGATRSEAVGRAYRGLCGLEYEVE